MKGILVTTASFTLPRTSTFTGVPALETAVVTYPAQARHRNASAQCAALLAERTPLRYSVCVRTHGDVLLQAGAEAAAGHLSNLRTRRIQNLGVLPRGRARRDEQPHAALGGTLSQLRLDDRASQEVERLATALPCSRSTRRQDATHRQQAQSCELLRRQLCCTA
jgi:hypothetical protein